MSKLFSEIFGCYYNVITRIVNNSPMTEQEVIDIINGFGFSESCFHLLPKIKELPFMEFKNGKYYSKLKNKIKLPVTNIEKSWIKSISNDPRFGLFVNNFDETILKDIKPLYTSDIFKVYDKYSDGDEFRNEQYIKNFRKINEAMNNKKVVKIIYKSPKKEQITIVHYLPLKFEFSAKDDKFRFFAAKIKNGKIVDYVCLNMARILEVRNSPEVCLIESELEKHIETFDTQNPIIVEVYNERNAIERFMIEFSAYRKRSEFDEKKEICTTKIYYRKTDETEVLIKLLSFGPVLKVLGPEHFLEKFRYRINKQAELINLCVP